MTYSLTTGGILIAIVGSLVAGFGFSDSCSSEVTAKLTPLIGALPGLITAWIGRVRKGDVNILGFRK